MQENIYTLINKLYPYEFGLYKAHLKHMMSGKYVSPASFKINLILSASLFERVSINLLTSVNRGVSRMVGLGTRLSDDHCLTTE